MKVRYTSQAFAEREQIFEYLKNRSPVGARNVLSEMKSATLQICQHPSSGYATNDDGIRVKILTRYSYKIFYRITTDEVEILHIRHSARQSLT
jgi:plasmid stabilization system protein ParE